MEFLSKYILHRQYILKILVASSIGFRILFKKYSQHKVFHCAYLYLYV